MQVVNWVGVFVLWTGIANAQIKPEAFGRRSSKPNILLILADDLARSDLGCYGHPWHHTPHLDGLARDGLAFTDGYASAPICSASRASVLTGKSPARLHFEFVTKNKAGRQVLVPVQPLEPPPFTVNLKLEEKTLAEVLNDAGYLSGFFGKWHLNAHYRQYLGWSPTHGPMRQGFSVGSEAFGSHPYAWKTQRPKTITTPEVFPKDELTERCVHFLKLPHRRPVFAMLSQYYVHTPVRTTCQWLLDKYEKLVPKNSPNREERIKYAAFIETMDHQVGEVLQALEETKAAPNTLVIFTSDNGGHPSFSANGPFRGSKWNLYEGGIRVPFLMRWPGVVAKRTVCREPVIAYDLLPTLAEVAGKPIGQPAKAELDGRSLIPLMKKPTETIDRALSWHFPYYHPAGKDFGKSIPDIGVNDFKISQTRPVSGIRRGRYKLLHFYEEDRRELYDLTVDPAESKDLSKTLPKESEALKKELQAILKAVEARLPTRVISRQ